MSNMVHFAHAWVRRGYAIFPVKAGEKRPPLIKEWSKNASCDKRQIDQWWRGTNSNIGVATDGLLVLDIDVKHDGYNSLNALETKHGVLPATYKQTTPTGGKHYFFDVDISVPNSVGKLGPGLDVRGRGGYVLGAGSYIKGSGLYKAIGYPDQLARAPEWLLTLAMGAGEDDQPARQVQDRDDTHESLALAQARAYLRSAPVAHEGGRNHALYRHACQLKNFGVQVEDAFMVLEHEWNVNNHPPLDPQELEQTARSAYATSTEGFGTHQAAFEKLDETTDDSIAAVEAKLKRMKEKAIVKQEDEIKQAVARMNEKFAFCVTGGRGGVLDIEGLKFDGDYQYLTKETARDLTASDKVQLGKQKQYAFDIWMSSPDRTTYTAVKFSPDPNDKLRPGTLNMWNGFRVKPESGQSEGVDMWREHLLENVAGGDEEHAHWVTSFFAQLVQRPWEKPLYALVLLGEKGTGKNAFVERVSRMIAPYGRTDSNEARLFSQFNASNEHLLLHVLDELTWGGNKKTEGILKSMITEDYRTIERKYFDQYEARNFTRYVVLSNSDWAVPMTKEERRFYVLEVKKNKQQRASYFEKMRKLLDGGENVHLMHYLMNYDMTGVSFSQPPVTEAGIKQKLRNSPVADWWVGDILHNGTLPGMKEWQAGQKFSTKALCEIYNRVGPVRMTPKRFSEELAAVRGEVAKPMRVEGAVLRGIETRTLDEEISAVNVSMQGVEDAK